MGRLNQLTWPTTCGLCEPFHMAHKARAMWTGSHGPESLGHVDRFTWPRKPVPCGPVHMAHKAWAMWTGSHGPENLGHVDRFTWPRKPGPCEPLHLAHKARVRKLRLIIFCYFGVRGHNLFTFFTFPLSSLFDNFCSCCCHDLLTSPIR